MKLSDSIPFISAAALMALLAGNAKAFSAGRPGSGSCCSPAWGRICSCIAAMGMAAADQEARDSRHLSDIMTRDVETVAENTPVPEIAGILERKRVKRVPVVGDGKVVGIVSRSNLLQALAFTDTLALHAPGSSDEDRRQRVQKALSEVPGVQANLINFIVKDGIVEIWGGADNDKAELAVQIATENVDGGRAESEHGPSPGLGIRHLKKAHWPALPSVRRRVAKS